MTVTISSLDNQQRASHSTERPHQSHHLQCPQRTIPWDRPCLLGPPESGTQSWCCGSQDQSLKVSKLGDHLEQPLPQLSPLRPLPPWGQPRLPPKQSEVPAERPPPPRVETASQEGCLAALCSADSASLLLQWQRNWGPSSCMRLSSLGCVPSWEPPDHPSRPPGQALTGVGARQTWPSSPAPALDTLYSSANGLVCFISGRKKFYFKWTEKRFLFTQNMHQFPLSTPTVDVASE